MTTYLDVIPVNPIQVWLLTNDDDRSWHRVTWSQSSRKEDLGHRESVSNWFLTRIFLISEIKCPIIFPWISMISKQTKHDNRMPSHRSKYNDLKICYNRMTFHFISSFNILIIFIFCINKYLSCSKKVSGPVYCPVGPSKWEKGCTYTCTVSVSQLNSACHRSVYSGQGEHNHSPHTISAFASDSDLTRLKRWIE